MKEKQQLQQKLRVANTRREDSQQQLQQQVSDVIISLWAGLLSVDFTEEEKCSSVVIRNTEGYGET